MSTPSRGGLRPFQPIKFGRYTLLNLVAKGGMGAVYLARMASVEGFEKFVVIKKILPVLAQQQDFVGRFVDEAKIVVKLQHGSIAQVLDMGVEDGEYYIAMEFVDGKDLRRIAAHLRDRGTAMPVGLALYVIVRVLDALAYAHRKKDVEERDLNLVHRDISPQNVLVSYEGEVKVIDFGLAKSAASLGRTSPSVVLGKFFYMSPEQARHKNVDRRTDLYAAALCLWEMLVGRSPFDGVKPFEIMRTVANPSIPSLKALRPDVPDALDEALMKALAVEPDDRYSSAEEMRGRLTAVMLEIDPSAGPESLAAFMREQFRGEYESERRAIASLAKVVVQDDGGSAAPSAAVAAAQAAFKPTEARGLDATAARVVADGPQPAAPRRASQAALPAARRGGRITTPPARRVVETSEEPVDVPTPVGRQTFEADDRPTPVGAPLRAARANTPRQTPSAAPRQPKKGPKSALLVGVGIAGLVGAAILGLAVFKPFPAPEAARNPAVSPGIASPIAAVPKPPAGPTPLEPTPAVEPEPKVADAPAEPVPATLALLRTGKRLSKRELTAAFGELKAEFGQMKQAHDCNALGPVCSLSDGMEQQFKKMVGDGRKHEQLRTMLEQWAEALEQRRQLLANSEP